MEYKTLCEQLKINKDLLVTLQHKEKELQADLKECVAQRNSITKELLLSNNEFYKALIEDQELFNDLILKLKFRIKPWDDEEFALVDDDIKRVYPSKIYEPLKVIAKTISEEIKLLEEDAKKEADTSECLDIQQHLEDTQKEIVSTKERILDIESDILQCGEFLNECQMVDVIGHIKSILSDEDSQFSIEDANESSMIITTKVSTVGVLSEDHTIIYDHGKNIDNLCDIFYEKIVDIEEDNNAEVIVTPENTCVSYGEYEGDEAYESFTLHIKIKKKG